jgi:transcriptional regulator with XRE-family HTH domain
MAFWTYLWQKKHKKSICRPFSSIREKMNLKRTVALPSSNTLSIGQRLHRERLRLGWSQERLAEALQASTTSISRWERDLVVPHPQSQERLAQVFQSAVEALFLPGESIREGTVSAEPASYWSIPQLRNPYFSGRQEVLEQLYELFHATQCHLLQVLSGLGGIGKTQIALEYAYQHASDYTAIFWINAEQAETIQESFASISEALELAPQRLRKPQQVVLAVQHWLTNHPGWLLIWDNVEDIELFQRFVPKVSRGAMLITTRLQTLGTLAVGEELSPFSPQEGLLFLLRRARLLPPRSSQEQVSQFIKDAPVQSNAAQELVQVLDGLPLALDQVGAYIEETKCALSDYLHLYRHRSADLLHRRGSVTFEYPRSVATTWLHSLHQVAQQNPAARDLLVVCTILHPEAIPEEIFLQGSSYLGEHLSSVAGDPWQIDEALGLLARYSLLHRNRANHTLSVLQLVQVVLKAGIQEQERTQWQHRVVHLFSALFPEVSYEAWESGKRLLPHVLTLASTIPDQIEDWAFAEVLRKAVDYLFQEAKYELAAPLCQRALGIKERILGRTHIEVAQLLFRLRELYDEQGKQEQTEELCQRVSVLFEQN